MKMFNWHHLPVVAEGLGYLQQDKGQHTYMTRLKNYLHYMCIQESLLKMGGGLIRDGGVFKGFYGIYMYMYLTIKINL